MSPRLIYIEIERRLLLIRPELTLDNKLSSDTIVSLINEAIDKFWKTRYSGINLKREGFEQTQKRIDDLRTLVVKHKYDENEINTVNASEYTVTLPKDYVLLLGDTAGIAPADGQEIECWLKDVNGNYIVKYSDTIEGTIETVDRIKENSLSEYHLHYTKAKPIRLISDNSIKLNTDGLYKVAEYIIEYLKQPSKIDMKVTPMLEYTDLPEHTHIEIVKLAVLTYLGTLSLQNYNAYSNEVNTME